jgi:phosphoribosylformylglycinamidine synthase
MNESQERMGLVIGEKIWTSYNELQIENVHQCMKWAWLLMIIDLHSIETTGLKPMDYALEDFFGSSPKPL